MLNNNYEIPNTCIHRCFILLVVFPIPPKRIATGHKDLSSGNDLEAILALEELVKQKQYASDAEIINYLGLAYQTRWTKELPQDVRKAVKLQPANMYIVRTFLMFTLARQLNKSQEQARNAIELDPSNVSAYFVMGRPTCGRSRASFGYAEKNRHG